MALKSRTPLNAEGKPSPIWALAERESSDTWPYAVDRIFAPEKDVKEWLKQSKIKEYYKFNSFMLFFKNEVDAVACALRFC